MLGYYEITDRIKCDVIMKNLLSASNIYNHMISIIYIFIYIYIVITVLSKSNLDGCISYYIQNKLKGKRYYFLLLTYDYYRFINFDLTPITGSYVSISYHQNSTYFRNYAFKQRASSVLDSSSYISPLYENCYSSINIFKLSVEKARNYYDGNDLPGSDYIRLNIPEIEYQSPAGMITMTINNYAKRPMYLMEITGDKEFLQVHPEIGKTETYDPFPFITNLPKENENIRNVKILKRSDIEKWFAVSLCLLSIVISILCLIFTIKYRNNKIIKCSSPLYYYCLIFGLVISSCSILFLTATPTPSSIICYLRINFCLFSVIFVSSMLLVKATKYNFSKKKRIHKV